VIAKAQRNYLKQATPKSFKNQRKRENVMTKKQKALKFRRIWQMEKALETLKNDSSPYLEQALGPRSVASTVSAPSAVFLPALETRQRLSLEVLWLLGLETRDKLRFEVPAQACAIDSTQLSI
jgi:hypothetical protein